MPTQMKYRFNALNNSVFFDNDILYCLPRHKQFTRAISNPTLLVLLLYLSDFPDLLEKPQDQAKGVRELSILLSSSTKLGFSFGIREHGITFLFEIFIRSQE